jgi:hypothetical protein
MNRACIAFIVLLVVAIILLLTVDLKLLIYSGNYYKCNLKLNGSFVKTSDDILVDGYQRFYLVPYKDKHYIMTSKGKFLGYDSNEKKFAINKGPLYIQNGIVRTHYKEALSNVEVRLLIPIYEVKPLKEIVLKYSSALEPVDSN